MTESKRYNGWTNYETWNVALWIDNEQGTHEYWRAAAGDAWEEAEHDRPEYFSRSEQARFQLADRLKDEITDQSHDFLETARGSASMWSDLLGAALSEVNWTEIADNWLSTFDGYESKD